MAKKWPFIPLYALIFLGIILGSFYDLQINQAVYQSRNGFGVFMASIGELPCYAGLGFIGGLLLATELRDDKVLWRKILLITLGALLTVFGIYYAGGAIISRNAYNIESMWYVGYSISLLTVGGAYVGGFFFGRKSDNPHERRDLLCMIAAIAGALLIVTLVKHFNPRPRYRWLVGEVAGTFPSGLSYFHNWWDSAATLKADVLKFDPTFSEEFKSFPSGHTTSAFAGLIILSYLPRFKSSLMKQQNTLFMIAALWGLLVAFSRLLIGAHFLTDVSFAALITTTCFLIMDFIVYPIKNKKVLTKDPPINPANEK